MNRGELRARPTCSVEEAAEFLGVGRGVAYRQVKAGVIPSLRLGRRLLVPVPKLLELVGMTPEITEADPLTGSATATVVTLGQRVGDLHEYEPDPAA